jgi:hypothetical protein
MTREEKKILRLHIIELLDQCQGCQYRHKANASIHICPSCPIGKKMQALGKKLGERKKRKAVRRPWTTQFELRKRGRIHDAS